MDSALSGLTIIEIPGGVATRYCGHLFAAHGATVGTLVAFPAVWLVLSALLYRRAALSKRRLHRR